MPVCKNTVHRASQGRFGEQAGICPKDPDTAAKVAQKERPLLDEVLQRQWVAHQRWADSFCLQRQDIQTILQLMVDFVGHQRGHGSLLLADKRKNIIAQSPADIDPRQDQAEHQRPNAQHQQPGPD